MSHLQLGPPSTRPQQVSWNTSLYQIMGGGLATKARGQVRVNQRRLGCASCRMFGGVPSSFKQANQPSWKTLAAGPILAVIIDVLVHRALGHVTKLNDLSLFFGQLLNDSKLLLFPFHLALKNGGSLLSLLQFIWALLLMLEVHHRSLDCL